MIPYTRYQLDNGLRVVLHHDMNSPMVAVNTAFNVGSRNEQDHKTGFAHLFEHLMFGGTKRVPDFDEIIQTAGGECNAFTNTDLTNYYNIAPASNLETLLWLEADRMQNLQLTERKINVQKKVVIEEFKETCINPPYGLSWHYLMDLCYKVHPYRWPTIGLSTDQIASASAEDVKDFFEQYYHTGNAVIVISGRFEQATAISLVEKWFGKLPAGEPAKPTWLQEPHQDAAREKIITADVPLDSIYMAFPMADRMHSDYYRSDLLSDILSNGPSSRLYRSLFKEQKLFSYIDAFITGHMDPGLFVIEGKVNDDVNIHDAYNAIWEQIDLLCDRGTSTYETDKVKNKTESNLAFSEVNILNKAINLAYFELIGDIELINSEMSLYQMITPDELFQHAKDLLRREKSNTLMLVARR